MPHQFRDATRVITNEHTQVVDGIDPEAWARAGALLLDAPGVFTVGTGRSGLALQLAAMRFMHLGKSAHVVGETTTPAIGTGDVLVAASGSGSTKRVVTAAWTASKQGAYVVAITTNPESDLAGLAAETLVVPQPTNRISKATSAQYAGSLFEQSVLILTDALFHALWQTGGSQAEELVAPPRESRVTEELDTPKKEYDPEIRNQPRRCQRNQRLSSQCADHKSLTGSGRPPGYLTPNE